MDFAELGLIWSHYRKTEVNRTIHQHDDMWLSGKEWYWPLGHSCVECVLRGLSTTTLPRVGAVLEVACNYGRSGRHLRAAFPEAQIWFNDIHEGADFCASEFRGYSLRLDLEMARPPLPKFDLVWIGSLFTHLTEPKTRSWLNYLSPQLNEAGIMVATFHGRRSAEIFRNQFGDFVDATWPVARQTGWGYAPYDKAQPEWGFSMNTVAKLAELAEGAPGMRIGDLTEAGWGGNHDVLTLVRTNDNTFGPSSK
jgi:SAM-dependent methyltransferase